MDLIDILLSKKFNKGSSGTTNYLQLINKPKINNVELSGNKTAQDLGLAAQSDIPTIPVQSVNGKTGAVNLASNDIAYDKSTTYQNGTVGAELQNLDSDKQDAPATAGTAGQVLSLDSQLNPVWSTPSGGGGDVTDVQINGTSILSDGVANIPIAGSNNLGLVKAASNSDYGVAIYANGIITLASAGIVRVKSGSSSTTPITPSLQDAAAFYGLAKAAGDTTQAASENAVGAYTEDAKSAIHEMLNGAVTVSGTTPTIAAKSGITYVCGEVATLDITPPASGIFEVQFVSGSTPTVLTATGVTWANGFDPTALEANKTYDISINNGIGVAVWI